MVTLERACEGFLQRQPALAGIVCRDDRVRDARRRQTALLTVHPECDSSRDVERIAADLYCRVRRALSVLVLPARRPPAVVQRRSAPRIQFVPW